jgi:predicted ester cyclase
MFSRKERAEAKAVKEELSNLIKPRPTFEQRQKSKAKMKQAADETEELYAIAAKQLEQTHSGKGTGDVTQLGSQLLYLDSLSAIQIRVQHHMADETRIVTRWTVYGKHDRDFLGMEPTGRDVSFSGITESILTNYELGQEVGQEFHYWDVVELLRQIQAP